MLAQTSLTAATQALKTARLAESAAVPRLVDQVVSDHDDRGLSSSLSPLPSASTAARAVYDAVTSLPTVSTGSPSDPGDPPEPPVSVRLMPGG